MKSASFLSCVANLRQLCCYDALADALTEAGADVGVLAGAAGAPGADIGVGLPGKNKGPFWPQAASWLNTRPESRANSKDVIRFTIRIPNGLIE